MEQYYIYNKSINHTILVLGNSVTPTLKFESTKPSHIYIYMFSIKYILNMNVPINPYKYVHKRSINCLISNSHTHTHVVPFIKVASYSPKPDTFIKKKGIKWEKEKEAARNA